MGPADLARVHFLSVNEPHIQFECGGIQAVSAVIKTFKRHPNFDQDQLYFDVHLPVKDIYAPPLNIRVFDNRKFGRKPLVGSTAITTLAIYEKDLNMLGKTPEAVQDQYYQELARKAAERRAREALLLDTDAIESDTKVPETFPVQPSQDVTAAPNDIEMKPMSPAGAGVDIDLPGASTPAVSAGDATVPSLAKSTSRIEPSETIADNAKTPTRPDGAAATEVDLGGFTGALMNIKAGMKAVYQKLAGDDPDSKLDKEVVLDWWSKFYSSIGHEEAGPKYKGDLLQVLTEPLEMVYELSDEIHSFELFKGSADMGRIKTGKFRGNFAVFVLDAQGHDPTEYDEAGNLITPFAAKSAAKSKSKITLNQAAERMGLRRRTSRRERERLAVGGKKVADVSQDSNQTVIQKIWPSLPNKEPVEVLVRLYLVRGLELTPRDDNGLSDPFVIVTFGKNKPMNDKKNYIARTLNPIFGRVFEQECILPRDSELSIQVFDYDMVSANDLIGTTKIDLEERWLTSKRGAAGIARTYLPRGINKWRDMKKPTEILNEWCVRNHLPEPVYSNEHDTHSVAIFNFNHGEPFYAQEMEDLTAEEELKEEEYDEIMKENAALVALHSTGIVKEYVESRPLYDPAQPDLEQGKLQLWVDMFPKIPGVPYPPPVDISPRKPKGYVLRVIVWNTAECDLKDVAFTGEKMSDLYVKGFIRGLEKQKQKTDVHYRSLDGDGNFNWRMVFPFMYQPAEELMVIERKPHIFSREVEIVKVPPVLSLQIWDADVFHSDDYIGSIEIDLNHFVNPGQRAASATRLTDENLSSKNHQSLFRKRRARGWYTVTVREKKKKAEDDKKSKKKKKKKGETEPEYEPERASGKIEIELELLTEEEALERPAGPAREEPNQYPHLDPPNRPETSFFWLTNPWKSWKFVIWKHYKWYFILAFLLIILGLLIFLFVYTAPTALMQGLVAKI